MPCESFQNINGLGRNYVLLMPSPETSGDVSGPLGLVEFSLGKPYRVRSHLFGRIQYHRTDYQRRINSAREKRPYRHIAYQTTLYGVIQQRSELLYYFFLAYANLWLEVQIPVSEFSRTLARERHDMSRAELFYVAKYAARRWHIPQSEEAIE